MLVTQIESVPGPRVAYDLTVANTSCYFVGSGVLAHNCNAVYEKGKLVQAITRGDGSIGEDITPNVLKMQGIQAKLPEKFTGSLRGEIVLHRDALAEHFPDKTSTRNSAAGTAKRLDGVGCEHLTVYFYRIADGIDFPSESEMFEKLVSWGIKVPNWYLTAMSPGIKTPQDIWFEYQQGKRDALPYDIDGLVIAVNDMAEQLALGDDGGRPKGAVAYKFTALSRETTLRKIEWQVGSIGRITPVGFFDPVTLLGAKVSQASLYNQAYITGLKLDVGARILVARANDVIPRIVSVVRGTGTIAEAPKNCPVCGAPTEWEGKHLVCPNKSGCPSHASGRIKQWVAEQGILEWGDTLIDKLVESGLVKNGVPDLYRLTLDQLAGLERMGERSAEAVYKTLHAAKEIPLERFLGGLSIPFCATSTIRKVMDTGYSDGIIASGAFQATVTLEIARRKLDTLENIRGASMADLMRVDGLGPVRVESLFNWLKENATLLDDLLTVEW